MIRSIVDRLKVEVDVQAEAEVEVEVEDGVNMNSI